MREVTLADSFTPAPVVDVSGKDSLISLNVYLLPNPNPMLNTNEILLVDINNPDYRYRNLWLRYSATVNSISATP